LYAVFAGKPNPGKGIVPDTIPTLEGGNISILAITEEYKGLIRQ
jgi:hypothetical protein